MVFVQPNTEVSVNKKTLDSKKVLMWIITILLPFIALQIPTTEVFTSEIRLFMAVTILAILIFAFETMTMMIPALLLPIAYLLLDIAPAEVVFRPWTLDVPWMMLGGILMANVFQSIGLLKRLAYWCIVKTGGTYNGILYGTALAGIGLNLLIPGNTMIPLAAFTYGICIALGLGKSKEAAGIMLTGCVASLMPMFFFYNPSIIGIILGTGSTVAPVSLSWIQYFIHNLPSIAWMFLLVFVISKLFKPSKSINCKDYINEEYSKLGKMTLAEKKGAFISFLLIAFLMTGQIHNIQLAWGFVIAACLLYFPGIDIGTDTDIKNINYPLLFFVASCMTIGQVATMLGLGNILSNAMLPYMESSGPAVTMMLIWLLCVVGNFLLTPLAIIATMAAPLTQIALDLGINPLAIYYVIAHGIDQIILPYEYALVLIFFSFGLICLKDFIKFFSIKMLLNFLFVLFVLIPYWKLIGLI